jgi:hypothetical protein
MPVNTNSRTAFSLGVRGKILLLFAASTLLLLAASAMGSWKFYTTVEAFQGDVIPSQNNAVNVEVLEANFKKQVQEWKDTLLRGKQPDALEKHWTNFQQRESDVRNGAERLSKSVPDAEAVQLVVQFLAAHKQMGEAYRRGLQEFTALTAPSATRPWPASIASPPSSSPSQRTVCCRWRRHGRRKRQRARTVRFG